jgi:hypothetical protein
MAPALRPLPISGTPAMEELKRRLWEEHQVEAPIPPWRDQLFIRVSIQAYNSPAMWTGCWTAWRGC